MSSSPATFQDAFSTALWAADPATTGASALTEQPGFRVYRNTAIKGCIDALQANYPTVTRLVGVKWMRAAAAIYVRAQPPRDARLLFFGAGFAQFLSNFAPAAELPYLPGVATLDRYWTESHAAGDGNSLDAAVFACLPPEALNGLVLAPHPAARWCWFPDQPVYAIWRHNREQRDDAQEFAWQGGGALLTRPGDVVVWQDLSAAGCAFLDACARGEAIAQAAATALAAQADADLASMMAQLCGCGAFAALPESLANLTTGENS